MVLPPRCQTFFSRELIVPTQGESESTLSTHNPPGKRAEPVVFGNEYDSSAEAYFISLSSPKGGEGWGEEAAFFNFPSPTVAPLGTGPTACRPGPLTRRFRFKGTDHGNFSSVGSLSAGKTSRRAPVNYRRDSHDGMRSGDWGIFLSCRSWTSRSRILVSGRANAATSARAFKSRMWRT